MNLHTFDELDAMAADFLDCKVELKVIAGLPPTEHFVALGLAFAMGLSKLGKISKTEGAAFKRMIFRKHKQIAVELNHLYTIYDKWIADTRDTSVLRSAYAKALRNNQEHEALGLASLIIGKLTGEGNIYYRLYERYCTDNDCKKHILLAASDVLNPKNDNEYNGRLPYTTIVDSLFRFFSTERMAKLWEQLGVDYQEPNAKEFIKGTPSKSDDIAWAVNMVKKICGKIKDEKPDISE